MLKHKPQSQQKPQGFFVHIIPPTIPGEMANYHTHGLKSTRNALDFQIVLPIDPEAALDVFTGLVNELDNNTSFSHNDIVWNIIESFPIKLMKTKEDSRTVLRVIFPDHKGLFPEDEGCDPEFIAQATIQFI